MNKSLTDVKSKINVLKRNINTFSDLDKFENFQLLLNECGEIFNTVLTKVTKLDNLLVDKDISENFQSLLNSYDSRMTELANKISFEEAYPLIKNLNNDIDQIVVLANIAVLKNTVVLVGANGSGKSTFVDNLDGLSLPNLTVIPAQKTLYFSKRTFRRTEVNIDSYRKSNLSSTNGFYKIDTENETEAVEKIFSPFSFLITALINEVSQISTDERYLDLEKRSISKWDQLLEIWKRIIPEIDFDIDSINRLVTVNRNGRKYTINGLSDGEKCILFYIGNVLIAEENGYIVVDEPETFLNPAIYNKLWELLIDIRSDCQFIFASHQVDFINARTNSTLVWCKKFFPPDTPELHPLTDEVDLPKELLTELVGSRKPILFCEGKKTSYDYNIFLNLFMDEYTVIPVDGHDNVIQYTKTFNDLSSMFDNTAVGIIDQDGLSETAEPFSKKSKVIRLPYNEIEMLMLNEEVMKSTLSVAVMTDFEIDDKINKFKKAFYREMSNSKDIIKGVLVKNIVDYKIHGQFIDTKGAKNIDIDSIAEIINQLPSKIDVMEIANKVEKEINEKIQMRDYDGLLTLCTLKGKIFPGLTNRTLCPNYSQLALVRISRDKDLQKYLRNEIGL